MYELNTRNIFNNKELEDEKFYDPKIMCAHS